MYELLCLNSVQGYMNMYMYARHAHVPTQNPSWIEHTVHTVHARTVI